MSVDRRDFLKVATTTGAGIALSGVSGAAGQPRLEGGPAVFTGKRASDVVVVGAGTFGMWTALNLRRLGATVTVVDPFGPANSRSTSGGETRGVRTSYGDRPHGMLWTRLANRAIDMWTEWDARHRDDLLPPLFFNTGDLILREEMEPYMEDTRYQWDELGIPYEVLTADEVRSRWPWINADGVEVAYYEPRAGVVRARRAIESVAQVFLREGGNLEYGLASIGSTAGGRVQDVTVEPGGGTLSGQTIIFAVGPWFPKVFPELMGNRLSISIGHVFYFAVPPGEDRFRHPHMPSYGVPGCTGWPALGRDHRGFRVRTGGRPPQDPDESDRWIPEEYHDRPREILQRWFPDLVGAPVSETRACHYESSVTRNFIVDLHPEYENLWLTGGGSAEAFKFGPLLGEYIAGRVLEVEENPELDENFRLSEEEFEDDPGED